MLDHRRIAVSQPGAIEKSYLDHVAIFNALNARDPRAATDAIGRHIDRIYATTVEILAAERKPKKTA
jgi:DNA-binding GntR family transcriptional regulator